MMVTTQLGHLVFNVQPANMPFYKDLLAFLGWQPIHDSAEMLGVAGANGVSLWFGSEVKPVTNDYDGPGVNHLALSVPAQADVDTVVAYLAEHSIEQLFETPRHRPEFTPSLDQTYYQVMFETPDRILLEVVYTGPKS
jgi:catechol 2,3-dioxygenase-like lactoylglutathione lyase family enzyme